MRVIEGRRKARLTSFRVMLGGLVVGAAGVLLAYSLGDQTTGFLADTAVIVTIIGIGAVILAGSLSFGIRLAKLWSAFRGPKD